MWRVIFSTYKKNRIGIIRAVPWSFMVSRIVTGITQIVFPYGYHIIIGNVVYERHIFNTEYLICNNEFSVRNYFSDSIFAGMGTKSSTNFSTNTCSCAVSKCGDRASEFSRKLFADITGFSSFICLFGNWRSMVYLDGT